uniref:Uncharacterized protein n=1 Tax=Nelumbo nucifera TaxID=4432 RepID=A0A822ZMJ1_NELNU|nr:TPA_asm: hypothetical protein HUJ06_017181 [Nelumbo nucifera]
MPKSSRGATAPLLPRPQKNGERELRQFVANQSSVTEMTTAAATSSSDSSYRLRPIILPLPRGGFEREAAANLPFVSFYLSFQPNHPSLLWSSFPLSVKNRAYSYRRKHRFLLDSVKTPPFQRHVSVLRSFLVVSFRFWHSHNSCSMTAEPTP